MGTMKNGKLQGPLLFHTFRIGVDHDGKASSIPSSCSQEACVEALVPSSSLGAKIVSLALNRVPLMIDQTANQPPIDKKSFVMSGLVT